MNYPTSLDTTAWTSLVLAAMNALGPSGEDVRFRDVITYIEAMDPSFPGWGHWGHAMKRDKPYPKAHRAVTLAALRLKKDGMLRNPKRGYYALEAHLAAEVATPAAEVEAPTTTETGVYVDPAAVGEGALPPVLPVLVIENGGEGVGYAPPATATTHETYRADAGLRRTAIAQTSCYGAWSARSKICGSCPLAGLCQSSTISVLAAAAAELDERHEMTVHEAETNIEAARERALAPDPEVADVPEVSNSPLFATDLRWREVEVPFACVCSHCDTPIAAGEKGYHVEGRGMFHAACVPTS